jgi:ketosteroid isomerase-like protein
VKAPGSWSLLLLLCALSVLRGDAALKTQPQRPAPCSAAALSAADKVRITSEVRGVLNSQAEAWNRGDLDGYMEGYWKSEQTIFAGSSGVSRGWLTLRNRYVLNYSTRALMGRLAFSDLVVTPLSHEAAFVLGTWQLEREKAGRPERLGGVFTLVLRKFPAGWRIISDHTSQVTPDAANQD